MNYARFFERQIIPHPRRFSSMEQFSTSTSAPQLNQHPNQRKEPMKIYPVSDLVNSPKTDDARCIEPVRIDRDFFERQWWGDEGES
jgi:putative SOS response-associated peptidase YedK